MTVNATSSTGSVIGPCIKPVKAVGFQYADARDIEVKLRSKAGEERLLALGTDYSVVNDDATGSGDLRFNIDLTADEAVYFRRAPRIVQETSYPEHAAFPAASHEAALDRLTMICQALSERLDRAITFRLSSAMAGVELPDPHANQVLAWDNEADKLVNMDVTDYGSILQPVPLGQGGTGAIDAEGALDNLGFKATGKTLAACPNASAARVAIGAEEADIAILKADTGTLLKAAFGEDMQLHTGTDLSGLTVIRNHIGWPLESDSQFSPVNLPHDGTYVFHVYPQSHTLTVSAEYKTDGSLAYPDSEAGEVRIVVEQFNGRLTIVSLVNMEA